MSFEPPLSNFRFHGNDERRIGGGCHIFHVCVNLHSVAREHCECVLSSQLNIQKKMSDNRCSPAL